jgi:hypothetical protein
MIEEKCVYQNDTVLVQFVQGQIDPQNWKKWIFGKNSI